MNQSDFKEFCEMLDYVSEQYTKPLSVGAKKIYWQGLVEYDLSAIKQAIGRHLRNPDNGQFMPKIADVVRMLEGTTQDSALIAWNKVNKAVRGVGTGQSVVFDDPLIHRVIEEMGGWQSLGKKEENDWPFVAKEFESRYRGYKMRGENPEYQSVLIGAYESHNISNGFKSQPPMLIGNEKLALEVMNGGNKNAMIGFKSLNDVAKLSLEIKQ
jgi:hypothetical protein